MYRPRIKSVTRSTARLITAVTAAAAFGAALSGCSESYLDRRDTVALGVGDAIAADSVMQMNDPWPRRSGDTQLAVNGQRMQSAIERYRTNVVTQPVDPMLLQTSNQIPATAQTSSPANSPLPPPTIGSGTTTTTTIVTAPPQPQ